MKLQLPNGEKITLEENIDIKEKNKKVKELTDKWLPIIILNWNSNRIKFFLDGLANYLVWHKEDMNSNLHIQDKDIFSVRKIEEMSGKRKAKAIPFSSLSKPQKEALFGEEEGGSN